ncbi:37458_t:CDS:2 [Gigaspora margarita]|uniref:37458_t:CDS:1 n=1 Tax=Gigaspora margarita TaxID=4874 RepID=A0ABN7UHI8_GIGMA|nr:37458_t:CDS:2 [Gigaspora margarita]
MCLRAPHVALTVDRKLKRKQSQATKRMHTAYRQREREQKRKRRKVQCEENQYIRIEKDNHEDNDELDKNNFVGDEMFTINYEKNDNYEFTNSLHIS